MALKSKSVSDERARQLKVHSETFIDIEISFFLSESFSNLNIYFIICVCLSIHVFESSFVCVSWPTTWW